MFNRLEAIEKRYNELSEELVKPETLNDFNKLKMLSKEQSDALIKTISLNMKKEEREKFLNMLDLINKFV